MTEHRVDISLTPQEQLEGFGTHRLSGCQQEAEARWGQTEAYRQSRRRAARYTKEDWVAIRREAAANLAALGDALQAGAPAAGARAMDLAEAHRQHIGRWFYDCDLAMHRQLATMYIDDPRFAAHYEHVHTGLARYLHDAIGANADRAAR